VHCNLSLRFVNKIGKVGHSDDSPDW